MTPAGVLPAAVAADPLAVIEAEAARLAAFGAGDLARVVQATAVQARAALEAWWNTPLTIAEAEQHGGYSGAQLRNLVRDRTIPSAPGTGIRIRRRDVPVRPGHRIPLGFAPAPVAESDFLARLQQHRALGGSR